MEYKPDSIYRGSIPRHEKRNKENRKKKKGKEKKGKESKQRGKHKVLSSSSLSCCSRYTLPSLAWPPRFGLCLLLLCFSCGYFLMISFHMSPFVFLFLILLFSHGLFPPWFSMYFFHFSFSFFFFSHTHSLSLSLTPPISLSISLYLNIYIYISHYLSCLSIFFFFFFVFSDQSMVSKDNHQRISFVPPPKNLDKE
jgi:hypothetical protein